MAKNKYDAENFPLLAEGFARQGMIDTEIAAKLGISEASFYKYQNTYKEFLEAIKRGKKPVDVEVENALLKRAQGYDYEEMHAEYNIDKKGKAKAIPFKIKKITKHLEPAVCAQIFWLKNRLPKIWRDKQDLAISGNMNITVITAVPRPKEKNKRAPKRQPRSSQHRKKRKSAAGRGRRPSPGVPAKNRGSKDEKQKKKKKEQKRSPAAAGKKKEKR